MHLANVITLTSWLKVSQVRISLPPRAIHDVTCLSVRLLSLRVCPSLVSLPPLPFLFHSLPVLCPAHHLQCRHRRGLKPLHSRTMRSIAPWRYTILSQVEKILMGELVVDVRGPRVLGCAPWNQFCLEWQCCNVDRMRSDGTFRHKDHATNQTDVDSQG